MTFSFPRYILGMFVCLAFASATAHADIIVSQNFDSLTVGDTSHAGSGMDWGFTTNVAGLSVQTTNPDSVPNSLKLAGANVACISVFDNLPTDNNLICKFNGSLRYEFTCI